MKTFILILFLLISGVTYSQTHYVRVSPKQEKQFEYKEGNYNNGSYFIFNPSISDFYEYKNCTISGYLSDPTLDNGIRIKTGWEYEYTEAEIIADSTGYFEATISTDNLPNLAIAVYYMGEPVKLSLEDVDISFSGKRF